MKCYSEQSSSNISKCFEYWSRFMGKRYEPTFYFDDFSLTPEPATLGLLLLGGLALLRRKR